LGFDDVDHILDRPGEYGNIIALLNSSYSKDIPAIRVEKDEAGNFVPVEYDAFGIKAITRIKPFPPYCLALASRCISIAIVRNKGFKTIDHELNAERFREVRDELYHARLTYFEEIKASYKELLQSELLEGRTADLYYPLLAIARLIDNDLFERVLHHAKETEAEKEAEEQDPWLAALVEFLYTKNLMGSRASKDIALALTGMLREREEIDEGKEVKTRWVTLALKRLGFKRYQKKTKNKTWFSIDEQTLQRLAKIYGISQEGSNVEGSGEEETCENSLPTTAERANISNPLNPSNGLENPDGLTRLNPSEKSNPDLVLERLSELGSLRDGKNKKLTDVKSLEELSSQHVLNRALMWQRKAGTDRPVTLSMLSSDLIRVFEELLGPKEAPSREEVERKIARLIEGDPRLGKYIEAGGLK
jgi:hypothetical protein